MSKFLYTWGSGGSSRTGQGSTTTTSTPVHITTNEGEWERVACGPTAGAGITADGRLFTWGANTSGQTGQGTTSGTFSSPTQVGSATDWRDVVAGSTFMLALKTDGTLWSWGTNSSGRTAQGTQVGTTNEPTQVGTDTDWDFIAAGFENGYAIKTDGTLWGWGTGLANAHGDDASTAAKLEPAQIGSDDDWVYVAGGYRKAGAINEATELYTWGANADFGTGQDTSTGVTIPPALVETEDSETTGWTQVGFQGLSSSTFYGGGVRDGMLYVWGTNTSSQIGVPGGSASKPVEVVLPSDPTRFVAIANTASAVLLDTNRFYTVGSHSLGQTAQGTQSGSMTTYTIVEQLPGENRIAFIDAGLNWGALLADHPISFLDSSMTTADQIASEGKLGNELAGDLFQFSDGIASEVVYAALFEVMFEVSDEIDDTIINVLRSAFTVADETSQAAAKLHASLLDRLRVRDRIRASDIVNLVSSLDIEDQIEEDAIRVLLLASMATFEDDIDSARTYNMLLASALLVRDAIRFGYQLDLADQFDLEDAVLAREKVLDGLLSEMEVSDDIDSQARIGVVLLSRSEVSTEIDSAAKLNILLADALEVATIIQIGDILYEGWVLAMDGLAVSQYENYPFNSFARMGQRYFAAGDDGIYEIETGDTDDGDPIAARLRTGLSDLGQQALKDAKAMYLGYTSSGKIVLKVITTGGGEKVEHWYELKQNEASAMRTGRVTIPRGLRATYWQFELANKDGADFEIGDVTLLYSILSRRIRR